MQHLPTLTDSQFLTQFENHSLDPIHFKHRGHIRLAWLYLTMYDFSKAVEKTCTGIKYYALSLGASDKFNKTITVAIMQIIYSRLQGLNDNSWQGFATSNADILDDALSLLLEHYSAQRLFSQSAKTTFIAPDIQPI